TSIPGWDNIQPIPSGQSLFFPGAYASIPASPSSASIQGIKNTLSKLCPGKGYFISIEADRGTGVDDPILTIRSGTTTASIPVTGYGVFNFNFTPSTDAFLEIYNGNFGSDSTLEIRSVKVNIAFPIHYVLKYDTSLGTSGLGSGKNYEFDYKESWGESFTLQLYGNENGLGFIFKENVFMPAIRVQASIRNREYEYEKESNINDSGFEQINFGDMRKYRFLDVEIIPDFIHDFLALSAITDLFYIVIDQGNKNIAARFIVKQEEYEPLYNDALDNFAPVTLKIGRPQQFVRNINSGEENNIVF
ncbi:MAG: hypothetical protein ACRCST_13075, partial [Turicibacter sp.]